MMDTIAFKTLVRPKSPNTYLLAPEGLCEKDTPDQVSSNMPVAPDVLFAQVLDLVAGQERWAVEAKDEARHLIHFIATSKLMRYKDDVDVLILPAQPGPTASANGSRLAVYSRSRVGHSDLGANRKRVTFMLECLHKMQKTS